jgi:hypothetical protein
MVEMAASASASRAARSLAAIVPGAWSRRNETFGAPSSSVNSADMPPGSMARDMVGSPAPVSSAALRSLKTVIATRPMRTSLGRRWGNRVNEGLTAKRLQGEELNALVVAGRKLHAIYADPPWAFEVYSGKGKQRSAERPPPAR